VRRFSDYGIFRQEANHTTGAHHAGREVQKDEEYELSQVTQEEGTPTVESVEKASIVTRLVPQSSDAISEKGPVDVAEGRSSNDNADDDYSEISVPNDNASTKR